MERIIDFRSDTVTLPTEEMLDVQNIDITKTIVF